MSGSTGAPHGEAVAVRDGLFTISDPPRLVTGRCGACDQLHFPKGEVCPFCTAGEVTEEDIEGSGALWAWTAVTAPPPGYRGEVPFGFGVVELDVGLRVITRLTESDPSRLEAGRPMRLVVVPLHVDDEGRQVVTYAFEPRAS